MKKIDAFAHILPQNYYQTMKKLVPDLDKQYPFVQIPSLINLDTRLKTWPNSEETQIISFANINPEDYFDSAQAAQITEKANDELSEIVRNNSKYFAGGVGMLVMNNPAASKQIIKQVADSEELVGVQIFTRHLGKSIADQDFRFVFEEAAKENVPLWLHPVFDKNKPDNNLVFSWEYELSQAMLQLVQANIFEEFPNLKILVHHAGAMVPFFAGRITHILNKKQAADFKKFYVDTAILGNSPALRLTIDYYGIDHVLYGTDAPFAVMPAGAGQIIQTAIDKLDLSQEDLEKIYYENYLNFIK